MSQSKRSRPVSSASASGPKAPESPGLPQTGFVLPPGDSEYYGVPPPAGGTAKARQMPGPQGWRPPPGWYEYYGISPAKPAEETLQTKADGTPAQGEAALVHEAATRGTSGADGPLPHLDEIQRSFGRHDVSHVKAHTGQAATEAARAMGAAAFTTGEHVAFAGTPSLRTAAHEAAHVVQQRAGVPLKGGVGEVGDRYEQHADAVADQVVQGRSSEALLDEHAGILRPEPRVSQGGDAALARPVQQMSSSKPVQRYEAGEHAQLGETQAELKQTFAPVSYVVKRGDTLEAIAKMFKITVATLKEANRAKLKTWPAKDGSAHRVEGFDAGEQIAIPQALNDLAVTATQDPSARFSVNGVELDYGIGIAMGDFFADPAQLAKASPEELKTLAKLIERERSGGKSVSTAEWQMATSGRYLKLAEKNEMHFAPANAALLKPSAAGTASSNHRGTWETYHREALEASQVGNKDQALMINSFADHFLTDAFSAGHLLNKRDMMEVFKSQLTLDAKGKEFTPASKRFFDAVAEAAFTGDIKTEFSKYETADPYFAGWHPNIDSVSRFSALLQGIHKEEPDLLANAVAKGIHDRLNTLPGGLPVENAKGDSWQLSGDGTLNAQTKEIAHRAVAQSQANVIAVYKSANKLDLAALSVKVWDYTPKPSTIGMKQLGEVLNKGTDITNADLNKAIVGLIQSNYLLLISELVKRGKLRQA